MDHKEAFTDSKLKKYKKISDLIRETWNFSEDFSPEEVTKVLGILSVNSFCVHDGQEEGTGLTGGSFSSSLSLRFSLQDYIPGPVCCPTPVDQISKLSPNMTFHTSALL